MTGQSAIHPAIKGCLESFRRCEIALDGIPSDVYADPVTHESTLERELIFLSSHTIHPLALLGLMAGHAGIDLPAEMGLAYSTAQYRAALAS